VGSHASPPRAAPQWAFGKFFQYPVKYITGRKNALPEVKQRMTSLRVQSAPFGLSFMLVSLGLQPFTPPRSLTAQNCMNFASGSKLAIVDHELGIRRKYCLEKENIMLILFSRRFWNPLLVLSGCLTMVSGVFLFLHFRGHFLMHIHELAGIIFVISCAVHILLNFRPLLKSLGNRASTWAILFILLLSFVLMSMSAKRGGRGEHKHDKEEILREIGIQ
jgi:uncharacterized membrane protein